MAVSPEFKAFILDVFEPFGTVRIRAMFGGAGIYADLPDGPLMFGLIASETVYLKVDDTNRAAFEAEGLEAFSYQKADGEPMQMSYHRMPEACFEDPDALVHWSRLGLDAALRARKPKPAKKAVKKAKGGGAKAAS